MRLISVPGVASGVSCIGLGGRFGESDPAECEAVLDAYLALGGNLIDTAHAYAGGESERFLRCWLAKKNRRKQVILVDKGCHSPAGGARRVNPDCLKNDLAESLDRLGTSYIDLYLLHRDDENVPVGPLLDALEEEQRAGRIHAAGASNWRTHRLEQAARYAAERGSLGFVVSSSHLSLAVPQEPMWPGVVSLDADGRAWHRRTGLTLLAWSAQARGWFYGAYTRGERSDSDVHRVYDSLENRRRLVRAEDLARRRGTTPGRIALVYVLNQAFPVVGLIGPERVSELADTLHAAEISLGADEVHYLEQGRDEEDCLETTSAVRLP